LTGSVGPSAALAAGPSAGPSVVFLDGPGGTKVPRRVIEAGDFYAATLLRRLGLADSGGLLRLGLAPYNTPAEMEQVALLLRRLASRR